MRTKPARDSSVVVGPLTLVGARSDLNAEQVGRGWLKILGVVNRGTSVSVEIDRADRSHAGFVEYPAPGMDVDPLPPDTKSAFEFTGCPAAAAGSKRKEQIAFEMSWVIRSPRCVRFSVSAEGQPPIKTALPFGLDGPCRPTA